MDLLILNAVPFGMALLLAVPWTANWISKTAQTWLSTGIMALLFVILLGYFPYIEDNGVVTRSLEWTPALGLAVSFYLDGLSLLFALVVTGVGATIFLYSGNYFEDLGEQTRFNTYLAAFSGAMLGVVLSGNLITLFIMWELTSITSFLLIGFKGNKSESARYGALQALIITGGGGLALLVGLLLLAFATGGVHGTGAFTTDIAAILGTKDLVNHDWYNVFTLLILIGAFTKSAQWPFHFWLPGAMEAPTPASAFLHSATMVKAGVYLLARFYPVLGDSNLWSSSLLGIGLLTMTMGAILSVKQRDLKALLAYSTVSKLGALVALIGLAEYLGIKAAYIGIIAHACYKAALFLTVGTIDHGIGTRIIDNLGGVARLMPITAGIAIVSALSMAGVPFFFGFVAKETLIAAMMDAPTQWLAVGSVAISATFTAAAAYIIIWDVFFRQPKQDVYIHHTLPRAIDYGPGLLAIGSVIFGLLLQPVFIPFLEATLPKPFKLELFPGLITEFYISMGAILAGLVLFGMRRWWLRLPDLPIQGTRIYQSLLQAVEWSGDQILRSQGGKVRYYLISILGVIAVFVLGSGLLTDLATGEDLLSHLTEIDFTEETPLLELMLLVIVIGSALGSIIVRRHVLAVLALGVMGYGVAGIFLIRHAIDVAFVQFLVETLVTILIIIILSRTSTKQRQDVMTRLWVGKTRVSARFGFWRDILISTAIGAIVFVFAAIALVNRPERDTIAAWHVENAEEQVGATDIVAAILTDFRGMDTFIEIMVFAVSALGILALLSINRQEQRAKTGDKRATIEIQEAIQISTPFTRTLAIIILPIALLIAVAHTVYGSYAPGDGFTAGVIAGLAVALWYIVFGYNQVRSRLWWLHPIRFLTAGLALTMLNAAAPVIFGDGFMALTKLEELSFAGITPSSTLVFEIGIALTVFGAVGVLLESIAHPQDVERLQGADITFVDQESNNR